VWSSVFVVGVAAGVGYTAAVLPLIAGVLLTLGVSGVLFFVLIRRALSPRLVADGIPTALLPSQPLSWPADRPLTADGISALRLARAFYYLGLVLVSELAFRPHAPKLTITLSDWLFLASLAVVVCMLAVEHRPLQVRLPPMLLVGILLFTIGGLLSSVDSETARQSTGVILRLVYVTVIWFWLGTLVLQRTEHIRTAFVLWVVSASLNGFAAVIQHFLGSVLPGGNVLWGRASGFTQNVSDLGGVAAVAFVPTLMVFMWIARGPIKSFLSATALVLVSAALLFSGSVGSVLAAAVGAAFWFGSHRTRAQRLIAVVAIGIGAYSLYSLHHSGGSPAAIQRIARFGSGSPDDPSLTLGSRIAGYKLAVTRIETDPLIGVGLDATVDVGPDAQGRPQSLPIHNIVIGTWFQAGILGLLGIVLIFVCAAKESRSSIVCAASSGERALAVALMCSLAAFIVFLMSEPALYTRYGWVPVALIFALRGIQSERSRGARVSPAVSTA
jgi:O-antigen ligase